MGSVVSWTWNVFVWREDALDPQFEFISYFLYNKKKTRSLNFVIGLMGVGIG